MDVEPSYYKVSINVIPYKFGEEKVIGCYAAKTTADLVAEFVRYAFESSIKGGINLSVQDYKEEILDTEEGPRLKATPMGRITLIKSAFTGEEARNIIQSVLDLIDPKLVETPSKKPLSIEGIVDNPKSICKNLFYSVVLDFPSSDQSHQCVVGYYTSMHLAQKVSKFITQTNQGKKGFGFNNHIYSYEGKFVQYDSGKLGFKMGETYQEIKTSCQWDEYLHISEVVDKAIEKWSKKE